MTKRRAEHDAAVLWDAAAAGNGKKMRSCCGSPASFCGLDHVPQPGSRMARMLDPPSLLLAVLQSSRCRKRPYNYNNNNDGDNNPPEQHEGPARQRRKTLPRAENCTVVQQNSTCFPGSGVLHSTNTRSGHYHYHNNNKRLRPDDDGEVAPRTTKSRNDGVVGEADCTGDLCTFNSFQYWRVPLPEIDQSLLDDINSQSEPRDKPKDKNCSLIDAMET